MRNFIMAAAGGFCGGLAVAYGRSIIRAIKSWLVTRRMVRRTRDWINDITDDLHL